MKMKLLSRLLSVFLVLTLTIGILPSALATEENASKPEITADEGTAAAAQGEESSAAQRETTEKKPTEVESVSLDSHNVTLELGESTTLRATVLPETADNHIVSWSSSDATVASVSGGKVTAKGAGKAEIIVTTDDGNKTDACRVTVNAPSVVETIGVNLDESTLTFTKAGESATLHATVLPNKATNKKVTWSVDDAGVATVDQSGKVTAVASGETAVRVRTADGGYTTFCNVEVDIPGSATSITLSKSSLGLALGGTSTLSATTTPAGVKVSWSSGNEKVAIVNQSGKVTAVGLGTATITATPASGKGATCTVKVSENAVSDINYSVENESEITFEASRFNNVCSGVYGNTLSYVRFDLPSSNRGTLYYNYDDGSYDWKVSATTKYYYNGSNSRDYLSKVTFVPEEGYSGTVTIPYHAVDNDGKEYSGDVYITITDPSGEIIYTTNVNEPITFDADHFDTLCDDITGRNLDYVKFSTPSSGKGTLYYLYDDDDDEEKVSSSDKFYYDDDPYLSDVTFVPAKNYSGTVTISFTGQDTKKNSFSGTVELTVSKNSDDITYTVDKNGAITFDIDDFNDYSNDETNRNLDYVKFTLPSSSKGTLYHDYYDDDTKVTSSAKYYRNDDPDLDDITFVPAKNYSGTVSIAFTGWNTSGDKLSGSVKIVVAGKVEGDVEFSGPVGKPIEFDVDEFNDYCKDETSSSLDYVKFTLPTSSKGTLYYDYDDGDYDKKVNSSTPYYRAEKSYLDLVTFVPAKNTSGNVSIDFTGKGTNGKSFSGTMLLTFSTTKEPSKISYSTLAQPVKFSFDKFAEACKARGAAELSSVKFTLPSESAGRLYENYSSGNSYESLVDSKTSYSESSNPSLDRITFVPKSGYSGSVTITYTGTDKNKETYTGYIQISVITPTSSAQFTDMGGHSWAVTAVEYLYKGGITTGTTANTYNPAGLITRGDFVLMLSRAFGFSSSGNMATENFKDVSANSYYAQAILSAKNLGIAQGGNDGKFNPTAALTREDAMVLLQRTLNRTGRGIADAPASYLSRFSDGSSTSSYAQGSVAALVQAGVIQGDNAGKLNPKGSLTRAEMAVILYRVLTL